jgi:Holliday junction resolvase
MSKSKGTRLERELIHMLHEAGWGIIRSAGSGSTPLPSADILAGNGLNRHLAIECKALKYTTKYFYPEEIQQLLDFAKRIGAEPWLGIRFNNQPWYFLQPEMLESTKSNNFAVSLELAQVKGLTFDKLTKKEI